MKRLLIISSALAFCAIALAPAIGKSMNSGAVTQTGTWTGTWTCGSGKNRNIETFVPFFNGKGMHVSITGAQPSEGLATFDSGHNAWFYTFVNGDGTYATMSGRVTGSNIAFKQVFPAGNSTFAIRLLSASKYSSVDSAIVNHKTMISTQVCTKS